MFFGKEFKMKKKIKNNIKGLNEFFFLKKNLIEKGNGIIHEFFRDRRSN